MPIVTMTLKVKILNSLKYRYTIFAVLLGVIVLLASYFGFRNVSLVSEETRDNIATRRQILDHVSNMRINVFSGYKALDAFLLDPTREQSKQKIHQALHKAIGEARLLAERQWVGQHNLISTIDELIDVLQVLDHNIDELIEVRIDSTRQYPSLALGNDVLGPNRNNMNNAIALVLDDPMHADILAKNQKLYRDFIQVRHLWSQTLSVFRLYLANRVGSFNEASLPVQEKAIETSYSELKKLLMDLADYEEGGKLNFEMSAALEDMIESSQGWYEGYLKTKQIHHSGAWRADAQIIKNTIEPNLEKIDTLLIAIDKEIELSGNQDVAALTRVAKMQTTMLILITGIGLGFMLFILLSLNRLVFRPIGYVARALKAE
ncbi:MAG: hypothetical protein PVF34_10590, partial [Gammaproteobacteria bacterium]